jgi:hypothetical protein
MRKLTCGVSIGADSMLIDQVHGRTISEIMAMDPAAFRTENAFNISEFLRLKHLIALKMALEAYTGGSAGGSSEICKIAEISYDHTGVVIEADIEVEIMTDKIRACTRCDSENRAD